MRIALAVLFVTSTSHADLRAEVHLGGGLEGGMITGKPRPDGVAEAGLLVEGLLPGRNWGFGASAEAIGRLANTGAREESKFDVTVRYARPDRRFRFGVGVGVRAMLLDQDGASEIVNGYDFIHLDGSIAIASWSVTPAMTVGVDFYVAWTMGCYSDVVSVMPSGDVLPPQKHVRCGDTITTTYTGGFATSVRWR